MGNICKRHIGLSAVNLFACRLIIEFELRTTAESGLVFYMARINHADFATIQVKEGMAHLGYDLGHGNTSVSVPRIINDGHWHKFWDHLMYLSSQPGKQS